MMNIQGVLTKLWCSVCLLVAFPVWNLAQEMKILSKDTNTSLRGLSVVNEDIVWVSGSNGKVAKTVDGGNTFTWFTIEGYGHRDFRDIHGFDSRHAIVIAVDTPAIILKTKDGGRTWTKVFEDKRPGMFLDALHFKGKQGVVVGDPIDGKPFVVMTNDHGETWQIQQLTNQCQLTIAGEAFFAASGSNIQLMKAAGKYTPLYVSGGLRSRLFYLDECIDLPLQSGKNFTGANGLIYSAKHKKGVVVGGDFSDPKRTDSAMVVFEIGKGVKIGQPIAIPTGYKSGVALLESGGILVCGTTGIAKWTNHDQQWTELSSQSAHAMQSDEKNRKVYLCGSKGLIAKIIIK